MTAQNKQFGKVRPPAHAGQFYPANPERLRSEVLAMLADAKTDGGPPPKAIIAPHAGYIYSGPIAASAYARLKPVRDIVRRVVLVGPSHYMWFEGLVAPAAEAFATPLGTVPVDKELISKATTMPQVSIVDHAHAREHSLEVQLPFLQLVLSNFSIAPLLVGHASEQQVGEVIDALWDGPETCVVVSSDLSHYHNYRTAVDMDRQTAEAIKSLRSDLLTEESACGREPIRGLLYVARKRGMVCQIVDLRNSGDTAGPRDRVVGYGAFVFEPAAH